MGRSAKVENPNRHKIYLKWSKEILNHIRKHGFERKEVESVFESKIYYVKRGNQYLIIGKTASGRFATLISKKIKANEHRIITTRNSTNSEKNLYVRRAK